MADVGSVGGRVAAVVLAAGRGTRFSAGPKLLAPFRGRPLVAWAIDAAGAAGLDAVVVVTGAVPLAAVLGDAPPGVAFVENPHWHEGQATSLRAGLDWCARGGFEAAVVGLGDQPLVPASAWRAVGRSGHAPVVTATFGGVRRPPVRLDASAWALLSGWGDEGARELMRRRPDLVGEVACEGDPADVDTLDDLRTLDQSGTRPGAGESSGSKNEVSEWS